MPGRVIGAGAGLGGVEVLRPCVQRSPSATSNTAPLAQVRHFGCPAARRRNGCHEARQPRRLSSSPAGGRKGDRSLPRMPDPWTAWGRRL